MIEEELSKRLNAPELLDVSAINHAKRPSKTFNVINPATGTIIAAVPDLGRAETEIAINKAEQSLDGWRGLTAKARSEILMSFHDEILKNKNDLATIVTMEMGKPFREAKGEVLFGASFFKWFAEEAVRTYGAVIPSPIPDKRFITLKQAIGIVGAITPWNFPNAMITRKIAPALAAGCPVIVKPAEQTPLSALALAECGRLAGLPDGVLSVIPGLDAQEIGATLCDDDRIRKLSFTGSTEVGRILYRQSANSIKKISLELGGNAPFIVFDDADLDDAISGLMASKYRASGQTCICANRIYVHDKIYDQFTDKLLNKVKALKTGDGFDKEVTQGPLIDEAAVEKVEHHIKDAVKRGAKITTGGVRLDKDKLFFEPTILTHVTNDAVVTKEETFGPIAPLIRFNDEEDVVAMANDTPFGLAAYFYSNDVKRIWRVFEALEAGMVGINTGFISSEATPFGGIKQSGLGREGSLYGMDEFLEIKTGCFGL